MTWRTILQENIVKIFADRDGSTATLSRLLSQASADKDAKSLLIFASDANGFALDASVDTTLKQVSLPICGGIFPAIFSGKEVWDEGTIVAALPIALRIQVIPRLEESADEISKLINNEYMLTDRTEAMIVLVDGLSFGVDTLLESLFDVFGHSVNYLGGGAGALTLEKRPCLFTNNGLVQNSAILAAVDKKCGVGVGHGLVPVAGPFRITEAQHNVVKTIEWKPAHEYFQEIIKPLLKEGEDDSFPLVSRHFSLGLNRYGAEKVVREAAMVGDGSSLVFGTTMRSGELVDLLKSEPDALIQGAVEARKIAQEDIASGSILCFNCCCRRMFLGERFNEEIQAIRGDDTPLIGGLTIGGEIGNNRMDFLEYYNRTTVVGYLAD